MKIFTLVFLSFISFCVIAQESKQDTTISELEDKAHFLISNKRHRDAIIMLDAILKAKPNRHDVHFKKANCHIAMGAYDIAIDDLEKAVAIKKDYVDAYRLLADLNTKKRNTEEAVKYYALAAEHTEDIEEQLLFRIEIVNLLFSIKREIFAKKYIDQIEAIIPGIFDVSFFKARYYNEIQAHDSAATIMEELIKEVPVRPGNERYFYEYAYALHKTGKYKEAKEYIANANAGEFRSKLARLTSKAYIDKAKAYYFVHQYAKAEEALYIANLIGIENSDISFVEGFKKKIAFAEEPKQKDIDKIKRETDISNLNDLPAPLLAKLSILYYQTGSYTYALETCQAIEQKNPYNMQNIFMGALIEYKLGQEDGSFTKLLLRVVKNPKIDYNRRAQYYFVLGLIYESQKNWVEAMDAYRYALVDVFKGISGEKIDKIYMLKQLDELSEEKQ